MADVIRPASCDLPHLAEGERAVSLALGEKILIYEPSVEMVILIQRDQPKLVLATDHGSVLVVDDLCEASALSDMIVAPLERKMWIERLRFWALTLENAGGDE